MRHLGTTECKSERQECLLSCGLNRNDRHPEFGGETFGIHRRSLRPGDVDHVERDDRRKSQLQNLRDEVEVPLEMRGVDHAEDALGTGRVLTQVKKHVAGDPLVGCMGPDAVAARQVEQFDFLAMLADELARLLFHGDAGIVGNLLAQPRQDVEEGGLAAVGIADHGVGFRADFGSGRGISLRGAVMGNGDRRLGHRNDMGRREGKLGRTLRRALRDLRHHLGGVGTPDAQLESPQAELHRITQRRAPQEGHRGAPEQSHLAKAHRQSLVARKAGNDGTLAGLEFGERNHGYSARLRRNINR